MKKIYLLTFGLFALFSLPLLAEEPGQTNQAPSLTEKQQEDIKLIAKITALGKKIKASQKTPTVTQPSPEFKALVASIHQQVQKESLWNVAVFKKQRGALKQVDKLQVKYTAEAKQGEIPFQITPLMGKQKSPYGLHPVFASLFAEFKKNPKMVEKLVTAYQVPFEKNPLMPSITQKWQVKPNIEFANIQKISVYFNKAKQLSIVELRTTEGTLFYDFNQAIKVEN